MTDQTKNPMRPDPKRPRQPPYGYAENYGSPGGDEPPATTDPGSGSAGEARQRKGQPAAK